MKKNKPPLGRMLNRLLFIVMLIVFGILLKSCKHTNNTNITAGYHPNDTIPKWIDWNILFNSGTSDQDRASYIAYVQNYIDSYITQYNSTNGTSFQVNQYYYTCPCDSSLVSISALPVMGSGSAPIKPPPIPPGTGGSGDPLSINPNNSFIIDSTTQNMDSVNNKFTVHLASTTIDNSKLLAVMDTGLDSALFDKSYAGLLWSDPNGATIRNFQDFKNFQGLSYYWDDDPHKHGTAVTALALQALETLNKNVRPQVMVLKVLDKNKSGSTFTVSCGLSYAIQHQATLVNASLGYYSQGGEDPILSHYVALCNSGAITILAAAGNLPGVHTPPLCNMPTSANELTSTRLFYPACFKTEYSNVISVTGLSTSRASCFYQNYSSTYVSVGVVTNQNVPNPCCAFPVNFLNSGYEGSSFATPIISGKIMGCLLNTPGSTPTSCLNSLSSNEAMSPVTEKGRYITYVSP